MSAVSVLEWVSLVAPLGVRLRDEATRAYVGSGLAAAVWPAGEPELRVDGVANSRGIFVFSNLPGMRDVERGSGDAVFWGSQSARYDFVLEVRDRAGRYLPFTMAVKLPQRSLLSIDFGSPLSSPLALQTGGEGGFLPLFSAASRAVPDGMAVLRAELVDWTGQPAAWALVEAKAGEQRLMTAMADANGNVMLPLFYPKPVITLGSPSTLNTPLTDQSWDVDFTVRYRRRVPAPAIPDLIDVLTQPAVTALASASPPTPRTRATLQFGRELVLTTDDGSSRPSRLLITP